jgi:hypothetical protein
LSSSPCPLCFLGPFLVVLVVADSICPWLLPLPLLFLLLPLPLLRCSCGGSGADGSMVLVVALALASFHCPFLLFLLSWCHLHGSCLTLHPWSSCCGVAHGAFPDVSKIQILKNTMKFMLVERKKTRQMRKTYLGAQTTSCSSFRLVFCPYSSHSWCCFVHRHRRPPHGVGGHPSFSLPPPRCLGISQLVALGLVCCHCCCRIVAMVPFPVLVKYKI